MDPKEVRVRILTARSSLTDPMWNKTCQWLREAAQSARPLIPPRRTKVHLRIAPLPGRTQGSRWFRISYPPRPPQNPSAHIRSPRPRLTRLATEIRPTRLRLITSPLPRIRPKAPSWPRRSPEARSVRDRGPGRLGFAYTRSSGNILQHESREHTQ